MKLDDYRNPDGKLAAYAWPGGYPIIYIADDGGVFCPGCANGENGSDASPEADAGSGWKLEAGQIVWEGPPEICDHCAGEVASAYGMTEDDG